MAINMYDEPVQAQFMNTYVPIPFQEMLAAGQAKQARYDKASQAMDATIASAEDIPAVPYSDDERRAKEYVANLRAVRDKYTGKDISDPFVQREMINDINRSVDKEDIKHIQQTYQGYVAYNKMLAENEQRGIATPPELRQVFEGYDSRKGVFTGTAPVYLDPMQETSTFFKDIRPDYLRTFSEQVNGATRVGDYQGVTESKVIEHAKNNMGAFLALPSIRQMVQVARTRGDQRDPKDIAMDYVKSNAKKWAFETRENVSWAPEREGGTGGPGSPGYNTEDVLKKPLEDYKVLSKRKQRIEDEKIADELATTKDPIRKTELINVQNERKATREAASAVNSAKIDSLQKGYDTLLSNTIDTLVNKGFVKTPEDAARYIQANLSQSPEGLEGRLQNFGEDLVRIGTKGVLRGTLGIASFLSPDDELKETYNKVQSAIDKIGTEATTPEQVLVEYKKATKNLESKIKAEEKIKDKVETDALNALTPYQETTVLVNDLFKEQDGKLQGVFIDERGNPKVRTSPLAKYTTQYLYNPEQFQNDLMDEPNKPSDKELSHIKSELLSGKNFIIKTIDSRPTEKGNIVETIQLTKDGKPFGEEFRVIIPFTRSEQRINITNELKSQNLNELAYGLQTTLGYENIINSLDLYSKKNVIPLTTFNIHTENPGDVIEISPISGTPNLRAILKSNGQEIEVTPEGVGSSRANLPNYIRKAIFKSTQSVNTQIVE